MKRTFTPSRKLVLFVTVSAVSVIGAALMWKIRTSPESVSPVPASTDNPVVKMDIEALKDKSANDYQVFAALIRQAEAGNPEALRIAEERANDPSTWIRAGSAEALGHSKTEETFKLLTSLLEDKEQMVRERAVLGLVHRNDKRSLEEVKAFLARGERTAADRIAAHAAIVRLSRDAQEKNANLQRLLAAVDDHTNTPQTRLTGLVNAASLAPSSTPVLDALEKALRGQGESPRIVEMSLRHLAIVAPERVKHLMGKLKETEDTGIKVAVVQTLPNACPHERWSILRSVIESESESIIWKEALRAVVAMSGDEAKKLLTELKDKPAINQDAEKKKQIELASVEVSAAGKRDPCL